MDAIDPKGADIVMDVICDKTGRLNVTVPMTLIQKVGQVVIKAQAGMGAPAAEPMEEQGGDFAF